MCWRWYFTNLVRSSCVYSKDMEEKWMSACMQASTHIKSQFIRTRIPKQQRANCQNTSFIYFHCVHVRYAALYRSLPFLFYSHFDSFSSCWLLLLLLFISSLSFIIIGESESTMINEVSCAVCILYTCTCIQWWNVQSTYKSQKENVFGWQNDWLSLVWQHRNTHTRIYIRRKRSHKTNQDLQGTLHKLRFSKTR